MVKFPRQVVTQHFSVPRSPHYLQSPLALMVSSPCLGCSVFWTELLSSHGAGVAPSSSVTTFGSLWLENRDVTFCGVPEFPDFSPLLILDIGI